MRVMLSCVGNRDPRSEQGSEGAVLTCARMHRPECVHLFPTAGTLNAADSTKTALLSIVPDATVSITVLQSNPIDHAALLAELRDRCRAFLADLDAEQDETIVSISSGTPQMQAVWLLLVQCGMLGHAQTFAVLDPQFAPADRPDLRVNPVDVWFLREEVALHRIRHLLGEHLYGRAAEEVRQLSRATYSSTRRARLKAISRVLDAWAEWDRLNWFDAHRRLREALSGMESVGPQELVSLIRDQVRMLERLSAGDQQDLAVFSDIHHQARRRFAQGQYAECVARFWRVDEGVLRFLLAKQGVNARQLGSSQPKTDAAKDLVERLRKAGGAHLTLDVPRAEDAVEQLVPAYAQWQSSSLALPGAGKRVIRTVLHGRTHGDAGLRRLRNDSVLGHGNQPVSKGQARDSLHVTDSLLKWLHQWLRQSADEVEAYPFGGGTLSGGAARHIDLMVGALTDA